MKIRVVANGSNTFISTPYYVERNQLSKRSHEIIDRTIIEATNAIIANYREFVLKLGVKIEEYDAKGLAKYFVEQQKTKAQQVSGIDFIYFAQNHVKNLINQGREKYAQSIQSTINFLKREYSYCLTAEMITTRELESIQTSLLTTMNQNSANIHLRNIRTVFNAMCDEYNNDETGDILIKHYPFRKFTFKRAATPAKRNLEVDVIRSLFGFSDNTHPRVALAHDVFMISFCLCGINAVDLYTCTEYDGRRITYYRHKTALRKGDGAKMSVLIPDEIRPIVEKYLDPTKERVFDFYKRYSTPDNFSANVNKGLKCICEQLKIEHRVTTYYARHSFATVARNECRVSKDDIAVCLTHTSEHDITDRYINESWETVDRTQRAVLGVVAFGGGSLA
ncbi:MAG: phage integrase SAM-like domain-containing protein [Flavobacteriales bacterium]|nr:phage integrase SAM-like domain-containing protein [Flavobacteriales bacterium]